MVLVFLRQTALLAVSRINDVEKLPIIYVEKMFKTGNTLNLKEKKKKKEMEREGKKGHKISVQRC